MSIRLRLLYPTRDFSKKPLLREETQVYFPVDDLDDVPSPVQQHHNEGNRLDTAKIVAHAFRTGVLTHTRDSGGRYLDAAALTDFREAMNVKARADEAFQQLPEKVRKEFHNDPREFVQFVLNEANIDKLRDMGLAHPLKVPAKPEPVEVFIRNPEPPKGDNKGS